LFLIEHPQQQGLPSGADTGHPADLLHLLLADGHRRTGKHGPLQILGDIAGTLDGDVGADLGQRCPGRLPVSPGQGLEDDQEGNPHGQAEDGGQMPPFAEGELPPYIRKSHCLRFPGYS